MPRMLASADPSADALADAFAHLPTWLLPVHAIAVAAGGALVAWVALRIAARLSPPRPSDSAHWSERARAFWTEFRLPGLAFGLAVPMNIAIATVLTTSPLPGRDVTAVALAAIAAVVIYTRTSGRIRRAYLPSRTLADQFRTHVVLLFLLYPTLIPLLAGLALVPAHGRGVWVGAVAVVVALLAFAFGAGLAILRLLGLTAPPTLRLARLVATCTERTGVTPRGVTIVRAPFANAFAFPTTRRIAVTERALALLDDERLVTLLAHEAGHLSESRAMRLARIAPMLVLVPIALLRPLVAHGGLLWLGIAIAALLVVAVAVGGLARRLERRADTIASANTDDPARYASALEATYRDSLIPAVMPGRRAIHPHLYDRMIEAGMTPDFPRPEPPPWPIRRLAVVIIVLTLGAWLALVPGAAWVARTEVARHLAIAVRGATAGDLAALARHRTVAGDPGGALAFARGAVALAPRRLAYRIAEVHALAAAGHADAAHARLDDLAAWIDARYGNEAGADWRASIREAIDAQR